MGINLFKAKENIINGKSQDFESLSLALHCYQLILNKFCDLDMLSHVFGSCIDKFRDKYLLYVPYVMNFPNKIMGVSVRSFITSTNHIVLEHLKVGLEKIDALDERCDGPVLNIIVNDRVLLSMGFTAPIAKINHYPGEGWLIHETEMPELILSPAYQFEYKQCLVDTALLFLEELIVNKQFLNDDTCARIVAWLKFFKALKSECVKDAVNDYYEPLTVKVNNLRLANSISFEDYVGSIPDWKNINNSHMDLF